MSNNTHIKAITVARQTTDRSIKIFLFTLIALASFTISQSAALASPYQESFADLVEKVQPAVVNISTVQMISAPKGPNIQGLPGNEQFKDFLEKYKNRILPDEEPRKARSLGSGFIIDKKGYVVTNNHVIDGADEITVITIDGTEYDATIVGKDSDTDLALLKINSDEDLPYVDFGSSSDARIGDWVLAIGNPFGQGNSVTAGIISGRDRDLGGRRSGNYVDFIQTDAPINKGNSGGPLFNMDGEVIGINSAIFSPTGGNIGIGFAIPSDDAKRYIGLLRKEGKVSRGWLGVAINAVDKDTAEALGLEEAVGVLLSSITPDGPADEAGLEVGDIILKWNGMEIVDSTNLQRAVADTVIGETVNVVILREGEKETIKVKTGAKPSSNNLDSEDDEDESQPDSDAIEPEEIEGMVLMEINGAVRRKFDLEDDIKGVAVVNVSRRSKAFRAGIRPGFVIERINLKHVSTPSDIRKLIEKARADGHKKILLLVNDGTNGGHITLELAKVKED